MGVIARLRREITLWRWRRDCSRPRATRFGPRRRRAGRAFML